MSEQEHLDPWSRWSWLMSSIWLFFLIFPITALLSSTHPVTVRVLGLLVVAVFAAVYVGAFVRMGRREAGTAGSERRFRLMVLAALVVLSAAVIALVGSDGLGMLIYVVVFAVLALPLRIALGASVVVLATMIALPATRGESPEAWFIIPIMLLVAAAVGIVRVLDGRGEDFRALQRERDLIAERERVARDVHDVLGHSLTVVSAKAELAERLIDLDPERARGELVQIQSLTREALTEIRATVSGLRIARLAEELEAARSVLDDAGIIAAVPLDPSVVDPRHRLTLAWVVREAVTNVVRHSGAARCEVHLEPRGLRVVDDGVGRGAAPDGNGLRGIGERVHAAGGELVLSAGLEGRGTGLEVRW